MLLYLKGHQEILKINFVRLNFQEENHFVKKIAKIMRN